MKIVRVVKNLKNLINQRKSEEGNIQLLRKSPLFDEEWYADRNPDVGVGDACRHYLHHGGFEGRSASPYFDSAWYLREYSDVLHAGINPLLHYLLCGKKEGRLPLPPSVPAIELSADPPAGVSLEIAKSTESDLLKHLDEDIDLLVTSDLFDPVWYVQKYGHVRGQNPYAHFLITGGAQGLMASADFDCASYLRAHPDVAMAKMNPLIHYLRYGLREGRSPGFSAAQQWAIKQTVEDVRALDPEFEACHELFGENLFRLAINSSMPGGRRAMAWREIFRDLPSRVEHIVFTPWLVRGGADLACVNIVRAAQELSGLTHVLLVVTDHARLDAFDWLPTGTQVLVLSDYEEALSNDERSLIVESLIFALRPKSIMNVNSLACWNAIAAKGQALKSVTRLFATLFCRDFAPDGRGAGYSDTHFRASVHNLEKIYFDTRSFILEMGERFGLDDSLQAKLGLLAQPILGELSTPVQSRRQAAHFPPRVLWAGRICHQKNTELLERIIRLLPNVSFDIWGTGDVEREDVLRRLAADMPSVRLCGSFTSFAELPLSTYSAYLFTSRFEGMPTVLINAAAANLPIVASKVGGVSELVTESTGWLVDDVEDETAYCRALTEILEMPELVERRLKAMQESIKAERSWNSFIAVLVSDGGFLSLGGHK